jgi:RND superfamily putative drug exporter
MAASPSRSGRQGAVARLAAWTVRHRGRVLVGWVVLLVVALIAFKGAGADFSNSLTLSGTQSQAAINALQKSFPTDAGDQDQIVFGAKGGSVEEPANRSRIEAALAKIEKLPHVSTIQSPFAAGATGQVSSDKSVAFAIVGFDEAGTAIPVPAIERVISTAGEAESSNLEVALGGQAIEHAEKPSLGSATAIGLLAAAIILFITFGSLVAMGLPIVTALLGLGVGISLAGLLSHVIQIPDFATELGAMIGLGVGIDYALFIVTRFRENHSAGLSVDDAVVGAMDTAGRAVLFAGATVILALFGQVLLGVALLTGLAVASSLVVLTTMLAALTALPPLLSRFGARIDRRTSRRARKQGAAAGSRWLAWSHAIARRPWLAVVASLTVMLTLAVPALSLRTGAGDAGNDASGTTSRHAYDLIAKGFGAGANGPLSVVVQVPQAGASGSFGSVEAALRETPGVKSVVPAQVSPDGDTALIRAYPSTSPQSAATTELVEHLRGEVLPAVEKSTASTVLVGGSSAAAIDFSHALSSKLALFVAVVLLLSALLLAVVFRSLVVPLQAAAMNLLSIGASLGVIVAIFQWGWFGGLLGISPGPIEGFIPEILFAIVFGLSMDYEVFILSRIHEHWTRHGDAREAVHHGMSTTGRLITAAAAIMICVFASFALGDNRDLKLFGISMASAVLLDAFVVRSMLLPAVLQLLGPRTWWMPAWLQGRLGNISIEGDLALEPVGEEG